MTAKANNISTKINTKKNHLKEKSRNSNNFKTTTTTHTHTEPDSLATTIFKILKILLLTKIARNLNKTYKNKL